MQLYNICRPGGIGDIVLSSAVTSQLTGNKVVYFSAFPEVAKQLEGVDISIDSKYWDCREPGIDIQPYYNVNYINKNVLEVICKDCAALPVGPMKLKPQEPINEKYVTIQKTTGWSSLKAYTRWDEVVKLLNRDFEVRYIENYSIQEAFKVIASSSLHISGDSFSQHVSTAYGIPTIVLFGSTDPSHFGHRQNINLRVKGCDPCYIEDTYTNGNKYTEKCKSSPCINRITPEEICLKANAVLETLIQKK